MEPRIFILEDDPTISSLVKEVLQLEGWKVEHSSKTDGCLATIRRFKPDIALFDVSLPDGTGFDVCRQLRQDDLLSKIPVIFMTSKGDIKSRLQGFEAGAQDYLLKPFDMRELIARICAHLAIKREKDKIMHEKEELHIRERLREDMMGMIVHDLRTPLSTIKVTLEVVAMKGLMNPADYDIALKNAENAAEWAILMVNDLLDLDSGKLNVVYKPLHLKELVERLEALFRAQLEHRRISLEIETPKDEQKVETDTVLLLRVLINIIANAVKFSAPQGKIGLKARYIGEKLAIEITDEGPGVPEAEKEKIFQKYYRANVPQTKLTVGNGIGLAFCRLAANALGGRVWVENRPKGGCCFRLEIPVATQVLL